jgi:parvulin-like peptidyl-prolyl isomerase
VARGQGWSVGETDGFSRAEPPKGRDALPGQVVVAALQTASGQVSAPVQAPTGVYLVKGLDRKAPDPNGFEAERDELRKQVLEQKRSLVIESWLRGLRAQAKVVVEAQPAGAR